MRIDNSIQSLIGTSTTYKYNYKTEKLIAVNEADQEFVEWYNNGTQEKDSFIGKDVVSF